MVQSYGNSHRSSSKCISSQGKHFFSGRGKWLSLATCVVVLLIAALTLAQGVFSGTQGAHAASVKPTTPSRHGTSSKHVVSSKHGTGSAKHAHSSSAVGKSKPVISAAPLKLSFSAAAGVIQAPATQVITVSNGGTRALYWHATVSPSTATWITLLPYKVQPLGIRTSSDTPSQLTVGINLAGLSAGTYSAQITLTGTDQESQPIGGSPQTIIVTLTVS